MSRRSPLPQPSAGISRVDQTSTRTHGYVGRLGYRQTESGWRPAHKAFFGDASHGGPAGALKAAEAWLKTTRRKLGTEEKPVARKATVKAVKAVKPAKATKPAKPAARPAAKKAKPAPRRATAKKVVAKRAAGAVRVTTRKRKAAARAR